MIASINNPSLWLYLIGCLSLLGCVLLYVDRWWQCRQRIRTTPGLLGYAAAQHWAAYLETRGYLLLFPDRLVYESPHGQSLAVDRSSILSVCVQRTFNGRREWLWGARPWLVVTYEDDDGTHQLGWLVAAGEAESMAAALQKPSAVELQTG